MKIIQIENESDKLASTISGNASERFKLQAIVCFLGELSISGDFDRFQSYYLEFSSPFLSFIKESALIYCDPEYLDRISEILRIYQTQFQKALSPSSLSEANSTLKKKLIDTWFILGEWEKAIAELERLTGEVIDDETRNIIEKRLADQGDFFDRLMTITALLKQKYVESYTLCFGLLIEWSKQFVSVNPGRTHLLTVEKGNVNEVTSNGLGVLLPLSLRVTVRPHDADEDLVKFNNELLFPDREIIHRCNDTIAAVRSFVEQTHPKSIGERYYNFQFSIPEKRAEYTGDSWCGCIALLVFCGMVNNFYGQKLYSINDESAVSSIIDIHGNLNSVDVSSLKTKIETTFFSPLRRLVVSYQNMGSALQILELLRRKYPNRHLIIEGEENLNQMLRDRNLVFRKRLNIPRRMFSGVSRHRGKIGWVMAGIMMALAIILFFGNGSLRMDRNPELFDISDSCLIVKNVEGEELWKHDFGIKLTEKYYVDSDFHNIVMEDIDRDGKNECIIGLFEEKAPGLSGRIFIFDHHGRPLLDWITGREMIFGGKKFPNHYRVALIDIVDMENDGRLEIVTISHQFPDFPCCLNVWSLTGEKLGEYWHSGHFSGVQCIDIDGDGIKEIVALGQNNEYRCAVIVVLNPYELEYVSPQILGGEYYNREFPMGREIYYMRLPKSDIHFLLAGRDAAYEIVDHGETFQIAVANGKVSPDKILAYSNILYFFMDRDFRMKEITVSDNYHEKVFELTGKQVDKRSVENRLKKILYYDGERWVTQPTMTRYGREMFGR